MVARPKLKDIAGVLGISVATVSNAMSGKGRVSGALSSRIKKKAEEMGYIPSGAARALRTGQNAVFGLVLADIANPLFPQIAQAIENAAAQSGYGILIGDSHGDIAAQTSAINRLIERGADGLIIVPRRGTQIGVLARPVVIIDSPTTPGNTVAADHLTGGRQVGEHLAKLGHKNIVIIGANKDSNVQNDRAEGIRSGLDDTCIIKTVWVEDIERVNGAGCPLGVVKFVEQGATAFAAVSDLHALRALTELQRARMRVPDDVSVTGFDDLSWSGQIAPSLTTVRMDMPQIAQIAVSSLIQQIQAPHILEGSGVNMQPESCSVPMQLVPRQSSAAARKEKILPVAHKGNIHHLFPQPKD